MFNRSNPSQGEQDESDLVVPGLHGDEHTETSTAGSDDSIGYIVGNQLLMSSLLENLASYESVQLETEIKAKVIRKVVSQSTYCEFRLLSLLVMMLVLLLFSLVPKG